MARKKSKQEIFYSSLFFVIAIMVWAALIYVAYNCSDNFPPGLRDFCQSNSFGSWLIKSVILNFIAEILFRIYRSIIPCRVSRMF